jgi:Mce-associated membrane protein
MTSPTPETDVTAESSTAPDTAADTVPDTADPTTERSQTRLRRILPVVLAVLVLGAGVGVALLGWRAISDSRAQDDREAALQAARVDIAQVLSYDSKTLDADLARSRSLLSGAFAAKFEDLASNVIVPASKAQSLTTKAEVVRAAVIDAQSDQVNALLFVNQTTTLGGQPAPHAAINQVKVTMTRQDGRWLISDLQPL